MPPATAATGITTAGKCIGRKAEKFPGTEFTVPGNFLIRHQESGAVRHRVRFSTVRYKVASRLPSAYSVTPYTP